MAAADALDDDHLHDDDGDASGKRRRVQRACDICRRKKIRCDGLQPDKGACSNCASYGHQCTFVDATKRRAPPRSYVIALEARMERAEELIVQLLPSVDINRAIGPMPELPGEGKGQGEGGEGHDETFSSSIVPSASQQVYPEPELLSAHRTQSSEVSNVVSNVATEDWEDDDEGQEEEEDAAFIRYKMDDVNLRQEPDGFIATFNKKGKNQVFEVGGNNETQLTRETTAEGVNDSPLLFYGKASGFHIIPHLNKMVKLDSDRKLWAPSPPSITTPSSSDFGLPAESEVDLTRIAFRWPSAEMQELLVSIYFARVNPEYPILNEVIFTRRLQESNWKEKNPETMLTVLGVLALGSRYLTEPEASTMPEIPQLAQHWGNLLHTLVERNLIQPSTSVPFIQIMLLSTICLLATPISGHSMLWVYTGVVVRLLQDMGAYRKFTALNSHFSLLTEETYRRLWWTAYVVDRLVSADLGRPVMIQDEDIDLDEIRLIDDEYLVQASELGSEPVQPADRLSIYGGFVQTVRLSHIIGRTLRTIYAISKSKAERGFIGKKWDAYIVAEIDKSLNRWLEQVPPHLAYSPSEVNTEWLVQSSRIFVLYYYAQVLVHRPFVQRYKIESPLVFHSLAIVSNSGRSALHVMHNLAVRGLSALLGPQASLRTFMFSTHLLLISHSAARKRFNVSTALIADVRKGLDVLNHLSVCWSATRRMVKLLEYVLSHMDMSAADAASNDGSAAVSIKRSFSEDDGNFVNRRVSPKTSTASATQNTAPPPPLESSTQREVRGLKAGRGQTTQDVASKLPLSTTELQGPFVDSSKSAMEQVAALSGWAQWANHGSASMLAGQANAAVAHSEQQQQLTADNLIGLQQAAGQQKAFPPSSQQAQPTFTPDPGFLAALNVGKDGNNDRGAAAYPSEQPGPFGGTNTAGAGMFGMPALRSDAFLGGGALPTPGDMDVRVGGQPSWIPSNTTGGGRADVWGQQQQHATPSATPQQRGPISSTSPSDPLDALSNLTGFWSDADWLRAMQTTQF